MLTCLRRSLLVTGGAACHEGYESCFFRELRGDGSVSVCCARVFDPKEVYK